MLLRSSLQAGGWVSTPVPIEEVNWGEAQELDVVRRWAQLSEFGKQAKRYVKSLEFDPYDVLVLAQMGVPLCALEVKVRRSAFGKYGDVLAPMKKFEFAVQMRSLGFPYLLVTQYACGTLVEVDLSEAPVESRPIARRDRPGMTPVPHGLWKDSQLRMLAGAS